MAEIKRRILVDAHWIEAVCISRYLNVNGVPSAVERAGVRRLRVVVSSKKAARARKLLSTRQKGDCGLKLGNRY